MKKLTMMFVAAICLIGTSAMAQTINYEVQPINVISASGANLVVSTAVPGSAPTQASDTAGTYAITTNGTGMKISASIDSNMPQGLTLKVNLAAPAGATSLGAQTLSAEAVDLVTGITTLSASGKSMTYTLDATVAAGVVPAASKTATFTVTAGQ